MYTIWIGLFKQLYTSFLLSTATTLAYCFAPPLTLASTTTTTLKPSTMCRLPRSLVSSPSPGASTTPARPLSRCPLSRLPPEVIKMLKKMHRLSSDARPRTKSFPHFTAGSQALRYGRGRTRTTTVKFQQIPCILGPRRPR